MAGVFGITNEMLIAREQEEKSQMVSSSLESIQSLIANLEEKEMDVVEVKRLQGTVGQLMWQVRDRKLEMQEDLYSVLESFRRGIMDAEQFEAFLNAEQSKSSYLLDMSANISGALALLCEHFQNVIDETDGDVPASKDFMQTFNAQLQLVCGQVDHITQVVKSPARQVKSTIPSIQAHLAEFEANMEILKAEDAKRRELSFHNQQQALSLHASSHPHYGAHDPHGHHLGANHPQSLEFSPSSHLKASFSPRGAAGRKLDFSSADSPGNGHRHSNLVNPGHGHHREPGVDACIQTTPRISQDIQIHGDSHGFSVVASREGVHSATEKKVPSKSSKGKSGRRASFDRPKASGGHSGGHPERKAEGADSASSHPATKSAKPASAGKTRVHINLNADARVDHSESKASSGLNSAVESTVNSSRGDRPSADGFSFGLNAQAALLSELSLFSELGESSEVLGGSTSALSSSNRVTVNEAALQTERRVSELESKLQDLELQVSAADTELEELRAFKRKVEEQEAERAVGLTSASNAAAGGGSGRRTGGRLHSRSEVDDPNGYDLAIIGEQGFVVDADEILSRVSDDTLAVDIQTRGSLTSSLVLPEAHSRHVVAGSAFKALETISQNPHYVANAGVSMKIPPPVINLQPEHPMIASVVMDKEVLADVAMAFGASAVDTSQISAFQLKPSPVRVQSAGGNIESRSPGRELPHLSQKRFATTTKGVLTSYFSNESELAALRSKGSKWAEAVQILNHRKQASTSETGTCTDDLRLWARDGVAEAGSRVLVSNIKVPERERALLQQFDDEKLDVSFCSSEIVHRVNINPSLDEVSKLNGNGQDSVEMMAYSSIDPMTVVPVSLEDDQQLSASLGLVGVGDSRVVAFQSSTATMGTVDGIVSGIDKSHAGVAAAVSKVAASKTKDKSKSDSEKKVSYNDLVPSITRLGVPPKEVDFRLELKMSRHPLNSLYFEFKDSLSDSARASLVRAMYHELSNLDSFNSPPSCSTSPVAGGSISSMKGKETDEIVQKGITHNTKDMVKHFFGECLELIVRLHGKALRCLAAIEMCEKSVNILISLANDASSNPEMYNRSLEATFRKVGDISALRLQLYLELAEYRSMFEGVNALSATSFASMLKQSAEFRQSYDAYSTIQGVNAESTNRYFALKDLCSKTRLFAKSQLPSYSEFGGAFAADNHRSISPTRASRLAFGAEDADKKEIISPSTKELKGKIDGLEEELDEAKIEIIRLVEQRDMTPAALLFYCTMADPLAIVTFKQLHTILNGLKGFTSGSEHLDFAVVRKRIMECVSAVPLLDRFITRYTGLHKKWAQSRFAVFAKRGQTGGNADVAFTCPICHHDSRDEHKIPSYAAAETEIMGLVPHKKQTVVDPVTVESTRPPTGKVKKIRSDIVSARSDFQIDVLANIPLPTNSTLRQNPTRRVVPLSAGSRASGRFSLASPGNEDETLSVTSLTSDLSLPERPRTTGGRRMR